MSRQIYRVYYDNFLRKLPRPSKICLYNTGPNIKGFRINTGEGWGIGIILEDSFDVCIEYIKISQPKFIYVQFGHGEIEYGYGGCSYGVCGGAILSKNYTYNSFFDNLDFIRSYVKI